MSSYIWELRKLVGDRPLIMCCAAVIIIDSQGRALLQQRTDNGLWAFPGGSTELGEKLEETAAREAFEEVGLTCHALELFNVYSGPELHYCYPNGHEVYIVTAAYTCRDYSGEIKIAPDEVKQVAFFAPQDFPTDIHPPDRGMLAEFAARCKK